MKQHKLHNLAFQLILPTGSTARSSAWLPVLESLTLKTLEAHHWKTVQHFTLVFHSVTFIPLLYVCLSWHFQWHFHFQCHDRQIVRVRQASLTLTLLLSELVLGYFPCNSPPSTPLLSLPRHDALGAAKSVHVGFSFVVILRQNSPVDPPWPQILKTFDITNILSTIWIIDSNIAKVTLMSLQRPTRPVPGTTPVSLSSSLKPLWVIFHQSSPRAASIFPLSLPS